MLRRLRRASHSWELTFGMCGIAGLVDPRRKHSHEELSCFAVSMANRLRHRGPDDSGVYADGETGLALGFRRLSIQDCSPKGAQPMTSASGRYVIVYNGEVYNFRKIRQILESEGFDRWRGQSDTEVVLAAFDRFGFARSLALFQGMFAFALLDRDLRRLYLVRDRMGEKPLYFGWSGGTFVFASELKALAAVPGWNPEIDRDAVAALMRYSYIPGSHSIFAGIRKLLPGHQIVLDLETLAPDRPLKPEAYWNATAIADAAIRSRDMAQDADTVSRFDTLLSETVERELIADVPLGVFLSGGIDSSTIAALAQKVSTKPVCTFTIGFEDRALDESVKARKVARQLGTEHHELIADAATPLGLVDQLARIYDEPFADVSQLPTLLLAQFTREHVSVALTGDGGDELFAGYPRYLKAVRRWHKRSGPWRWAIGKAGSAAAFLPHDALNIVSFGNRPWRLGDRLHRYCDYGRASTPEDIQEAYHSRWRTAAAPVRPTSIGYYADRERHLKSGTPLDRMLFADAMSYLPDDLLVKIDRATMSVGLEARAPLLDHKVVEFVWGLPLARKVRDGEAKWLLKQVLYGSVPQALVDHPKQGFEPPIGDWLRGPLRSWAEELLRHDRLEADGLLDAKSVRAVWREHLTGVRNWPFELWNVLMFQAWRDAWAG